MSWDHFQKTLSVFRNFHRTKTTFITNMGCVGGDDNFWRSVFKKTTVHIVPEKLRRTRKSTLKVLELLTSFEGNVSDKYNVLANPKTCLSEVCAKFLVFNVH